MLLLAGGGWYAWTTWEVEQTRTAAREAIAAAPAMSGYPVTLEVGPRGQSIAISGLAPSEGAKSELLRGLTNALPGVMVADRGLAALPGQGPDLTPTIASVRRDLGGVENSVRNEIGSLEANVKRELGGLQASVRKEIGSLEQQVSRAAAVRSLDRARRRLLEALPDLGALAALPDTTRRNIAVAARGSVETAIAGLGQQLAELRDTALDATRESRVTQLLVASTASLRKTTSDLSGLIGQRPAVAPASPPGGDISDVAEAASIGAERLATVAAAVLQAASIRIPEPPPPSQPSARDQLVAYAARNAVFFANNEEFRHPDRAAAVIAEVARLAKGAGVLVRVVGYTDERGSQTRNNTISQARAEKVAQALQARGVPQKLIVAVGRATGPDLSPNVGPDSPNRRVEFEIGFDSEPVPGP